MRVILCLLCLIRFTVLHSTPLSVRAVDFPFAGKLPSNEITDIYQDHEGFIWLGTNSGVARYDGHTVQTFRSDYRHPEMLSNNRVTCFAEDGQHVYIGTQNGLHQYDKLTMTLRPFPNKQLKDKHIYALCSTGDGYIWVSAGNRLYRIDSRTGHCSLYKLHDRTGRSIQCHAFYLDRKGVFWICSQQGLIRHTPHTGQFVRMPRIGVRNSPFSLFQDREGRYWISTWGEGLWSMRTDGTPAGTVYRRQPIRSNRTGSPDLLFFSMTQDDVYGYLWVLSYDNLYALRTYPDSETAEPVDISDKVDVNKMYTRIIKDHDGNLWLSSYDNGTIVTFPSETVNNHPLRRLSDDLHWTPNLLTLCRDKDGYFWFNQDRFGICTSSPDGQTLAYASPELSSITMDTRVMASHTGGEGIWSAHAHQPVVYRLQQEDGHIRAIQTINLYDLAGIGQPAGQMTEDLQGNLWILAQNRIVIWNFRTGRHHITSSDIGFLRLSVATAQNVWAVAADKGLYMLTLQDGHGITCRKCVELPLHRNERAEMLCADSRKYIWVSTSQGRILQYDTARKQFTELTEMLNKDGHNVLNLLSLNNQLWIITHNSIVQYHTDKGICTEHKVPNDYMTVRIFRDQTACLDANGTLYAGGNGGFVSITPAESTERPAREYFPPVLADLKVDGKSIFFTPPENTTAKRSDITCIRLPHHARNISIDFTTLHNLASPPFRYMFKLEGTDDRWMTTKDGERTAFYNRIRKGCHHLYVKYADETEENGETYTLVRIDVEPAWWETTWAYIGYALLAVWAVWACLRIYIHRLHVKNRRQVQETITQTKLDYFTNVSHELLTPLTVISCVADYLEDRHPEEGQQTGIMRNHIYRLKHLLQQILDFRKSEHGLMRLKVREGNIISFIRQVCPTNFLPAATQKQLHIEVSVPEEEVRGYLDFDKADKILYNLVSNAIKYTPDGKNIGFTAEIRAIDGIRHIVVTVWDEGIGIPPKEQERIFTRFYTGSNGKSGLSNGIGLALAKELTEMHHGSISVASRPGKGSVFTVVLPIDREAYGEEEIEDRFTADCTQVGNEAPTCAQSADINDEKPTVMLVDDNTDLSDTIKRMFAPYYEVVSATGGQEALMLLEHISPDIIISDVMMPEPDGFAFCRLVKSRMETSHIPVILLTAKRTPNDRIEAYNAGADGYLAKPFETNVLKARIDNLLRTCRERQQAFRTRDRIQLNELEYRSEDTDFLQKMTDYIHAHLDDEDCSLELLANHTNVSKSTLNRKVKAMTGLTPSDFVRNIKLKYACMMLAHRNVTVSEVAYATGFSSPKYFTRCFKKEFGIPPTEYQQQKNAEKPE